MIVICAIAFLLGLLFSMHLLRVSDIRTEYNINITKEETWQNETQKPGVSSLPSEQHEATSESLTSKEEAIWSLGAEVLERSLSIGKSNRIREPAEEE